MNLHSELSEQPDVLAHILEYNAEAVRAAAAAIRSRRIEYVYLAARGTSEHAGIYGQYILGMFNGLSVALAAPSLFMVYKQPPRLGNSLVIGISQSGQSPDIVEVVAEGRRQGALTLAITNDPQSPLARSADLVLAIAAGPERAVAATKTYTATLMVLAMLSAALADDAQRWSDLARVPAAVAAALHQEPAIQALAAQHTTMTRCVLLGRGLHHATALEWALKLKELTYVVADPYSTAAFLHGPIALIESGFPVFAIAPSGAVYAETQELAAKLAEERGASVAVISDRHDLLLDGGQYLALPGELPEWLTPLSSIVMAQLFCYHLAVARGLDPNAPRGLRKVTLTR